ncbi:SHOCT domain-containing protein [Rathayibacter sp. KR2-224]|uniref:SHOCT domain-containing protein n=1 Tax=Rathayibacter sp. KR2-224 TaxID=3400913 RepID=UPI003C0FE149
MPEDLVEELPKKVEAALLELLSPGETVHVKLKGAFKEGLICTDRRVIILKGGFMAGQVFGTGSFQQPYRNIAGVQVKFNIMSGYVEVNAGGMQNSSKSYWSTDKNSDPSKAPNCVSLNSKAQAERFRQAASFILETAHEALKPATDTSAASTRNDQDDLLESIRKLGDLRDAGILSEVEFTAKKAELLNRM